MKIKISIKPIKRYLGEILIIIGTILTSYNIFNFSCQVLKEPRCLDLNGGCLSYGIAYFYSQDTILWISTGCTLIVLGLMIIKNRGRRKD